MNASATKSMKVFAGEVRKTIEMADVVIEVFLEKCSVFFNLYFLLLGVGRQGSIRQSKCSDRRAGDFAE